MKPLFITLSLLLMFGNVHADKLSTAQMSLTSQSDETTGDQSLFNDDDTYFNQVGEMFTQGTLPTAEKTLGWWSGRCYKHDSPNRPRNGLIIFRTDDSHGPGFPLSYQMITIQKTMTPVNYYDTLTEVKRMDIRKFIEKYSSNHDVTAREKNSSWFVKIDYAAELRKHQDYFVMRIFSSEGDELTVLEYCYYFKKSYSY